MTVGGGLVTAALGISSKLNYSFVKAAYKYM